jgi:excisionase family DNA binding protein
VVSSEVRGFRPKQLARMLGISLTQVYRLIAAGELPARRLGSKVLVVLESDLREALERGLVRGGGHGRE